MKDDHEAGESDARESSEFLIAPRLDEEKNRLSKSHQLLDESSQRRWLRYGLIAIIPLIILAVLLAVLTGIAPRLNTTSDPGLSPIYNKTLGVWTVLNNERGFTHGL